jgi:hypothetical protein
VWALSQCWFGLLFIHNADESYFMTVDLIGGTSATRFQAVRLRYELP